MTDKQHDMLKESLSALLDDEAQELETRRVLSELEKDSELKSTWQNYQMIGDLMRDQVSATEKMDLTAAINAQIDGHDQVHVEQSNDQGEKRSWFKPLTSVAVAASVTLAVLLGLQVEDSTNTANFNVADNTPQAIEVPEVQVAATAPVESTQELEQAQEKLQEYLIEHTENSAENTSRGVLPYARVVNYGENEK